MQAFLPPEHRWPPDELWTFHIQRGHANLPHHEQTVLFAEALFGPVDSLQNYVKYGQAVHAEMMRAEYESARRDRPNNGGTMVWMYNDCWPTANWSIIDYYRCPKPSYYAARRACATWLPIVMERAGRIQFFFSNDSPEACCASLRYGLAELDGTQVWEKEAELEVGGCATSCFDSVERASLQRKPGDYLFVEAMVEGRPLPPVTYFPDLWRDVPWPNPQIRVEVTEQQETPDSWTTAVDVSNAAYARFCHLLLPEDAGPYWIDDNFFDLPAGQQRRVHIRSARPLPSEAIKAGHWGTEWP
jgi:beta-mannosidase